MCKKVIQEENKIHIVLNTFINLIYRTTLRRVDFQLIMLKEFDLGINLTSQYILTNMGINLLIKGI